MAKSRRKSRQEARIERFTWFFMVLVFGILYILPEQNNLPNWVIPASGAVILLGSGFYQYIRRWRVSPITWIIGTVMLLLTMINLYVDPDQDFYGITLLSFALVIGFGVLTGET
jgi:Na+/melibiose symporter-like transporter